MAISFSFLVFHSRHTASLFTQKSIRQRPSAWKAVKNMARQVGRQASWYLSK
jgi:hypothetical protein